MSQFYVVCRLCGKGVRKTSSHICDATKKCVICGKKFLKQPTDSKKTWDKKNVCSRQCAGKVNMKKISPQGQGGSNNYNWKGGRIVFPDGRVHIYKPEHSNATKKGYVFEHHLIMEKFLGRYLDKKNERVLHKNGNHSDNRIENLKLITIKRDGYAEKRLNGERRSIHRRVMEKYIGRKLTKDECVHHINGNKRDNRLENLQLMTNSEHAKFHKLHN